MVQFQGQKFNFFRTSLGVLLATMIGKLATFTSRTLVVSTVLLLNACSLGIVETARETASSVVENIRNAPSAIMPAQFQSSVSIDGDFRLSNAARSLEGNYTVTRTFFATNRSLNDGSAAHQMFDSGRALLPSYGKSYITLRLHPEDTANIELPSMLKVDLGDEPVNPAVLSHNEVQEHDDFIGDLQSAIESADDDSILIYIHGFNVSFEQAAIRSAQIAYDIGFSGTSVFYSWPAQSSSPAYIADIESARNSQRYFHGFMNDIISQTSSSKIYVVAQGLGARLSSRAMKDVFDVDPAFRSRLEEIILIAPDIESQEFDSVLAPALGSVDSPVTVYVQAQDPALASTDTFRSAALVGENAKVVANEQLVETINVKSADTGLSAHAGYRDTNSIIADLWSLISFGTRAEQRNLLNMKITEAGTYWEYGE